MVAILAIAMVTSLTSCSKDSEDLSLNDSSNLENSNEQSLTASDFVPDFDKVYTITSSFDPLTLATDGNGRLLSTSKNEITVQELWKFSPSTTAGSFYLDCLGGRDAARLSTVSGRGILSAVFEGEDSLGLSSSWTITSAGNEDYFITNLGENIDNNRLTSVSFGLSSVSYGARLTTDNSVTDAEKFIITEVEFPFPTNRAPMANKDFLPRAVGSPSTLTANVIDNDFDPDGDELTVTSITNTDNRISVEIVNNKLEVTFNNSSSSVFSIDVTYTVSDGNGGTSQGVLTVFRSAPNSNA